MAEIEGGYYGDYSAYNETDLNDRVMDMVRDITRTSAAYAQAESRRALMKELQVAQDDDEKSDDDMMEVKMEKLKATMLHRSYSVSPERLNQVHNLVNASRSKLSRNVLSNFGNEEEHPERENYAE